MLLRSIHCASTQILQKLRSAHPGRVARAGLFRVLSGCRLLWEIKKLKTKEPNHRWSNGLHMSAYLWTLVSLLHSHTFPHHAFHDHAGVLWWQRQLKRPCEFSSYGREHHAVRQFWHLPTQRNSPTLVTLVRTSQCLIRIIFAVMKPGQPGYSGNS